MIGAIEWWFEFTSLGISELAAEVQKEKLLFGTNDSNKEGDKQWDTVGYLQFFSRETFHTTMIKK